VPVTNCFAIDASGPITFFSNSSDASESDSRMRLCNATTLRSAVSMDSAHAHTGARAPVHVRQQRSTVGTRQQYAHPWAVQPDAH
jgi:hypothetical protein